MRTSAAIAALAVLALSPGAQAAPRKKAPAAARRPVPEAATAPAAQAAPAGESGQAAAPVRGPARIDFDDRLIQGQTNKAGSVYLYDRKELKIRSMVKKRESFREEITSSLYDDV